MQDGNLEIARNLNEHVTHLAHHIGERHLWRGDSLARAADYIVSNLARCGYDPVRHSYKAYGQTVSNIIAEKRGQLPETLVIGAHYDTVPGSPGADDNASAVAGLLELARMMAKSACRLNLVFAAFVNEESPAFGSDYMGSMQYARFLRKGKRNIRFMISLEMIGYFRKDRPQRYPLGLMRSFYPKTADFIAVVGDFKSGRHVHWLARCIQRFGGLKTAALVAPRNFGGIDRSDQLAFWHHGFKAVMVTDTANFRNPHYHMETDTVDTLDFDMSARVVAGLFGALRHLR
jgi:Zn-dependent M28 family amino/carboxypeptidase